MNFQLFPQIVLSATEQQIVAEKLSDPAVKKYFRSFSHNIAVEMMIYNEPAAEETPESFPRKRAKLQGQLETLDTFLSVASPAIPQAK